jgi:hypothetical protein
MDEEESLSSRKDMRLLNLKGRSVFLCRARTFTDPFSIYQCSRIKLFTGAEEHGAQLWVPFPRLVRVDCLAQVCAARGVLGEGCQHFRFEGGGVLLHLLSVRHFS